MSCIDQAISFCACGALKLVLVSFIFANVNVISPAACCLFWGTASLFIPKSLKSTLDMSIKQHGHCTGTFGE
ncbi:hypothetical protein J3495_18340 [Flavobacterium sp. P7388]|uniref:Uncharacterized protein n=1 Tax=Flavobacterium geliluteum TaxID=2816120 RepID=A0A941AY82_9FLAO|nr:hypothetical protein [Flavobacterium geliluteum]